MPKKKETAKAKAKAKAAAPASITPSEEVLKRVDKRITQIESTDKITPWNKAKLLALKEVRGMIVPPEEQLEETPAETESAVTYAELEEPA